MDESRAVDLWSCLLRFLKIEITTLTQAMIGPGFYVGFDKAKQYLGQCHSKYFAL
jgi:hypothetical protein